MTQSHVLYIVVPCHNEQDTIGPFLQATSEVANNELAALNVQVHYVFVDDGSTDKTAQVLRAHASERADMSYLMFTRNFGKEAGLFAGLEAVAELMGLARESCSGKQMACVMDADLQDPPSLLPQLCEPVLSGQTGRTAAYRVSRDGEPPIRSWFAHRFYALMNSMSDVELKDGARDYCVMSEEFVQAVLSCGEYNRFTKGLFGWVGFETSWVSYQNVERVAGESSWSFFSLVRYAIDGLVAYSTKPLEFFMAAGLGLSGISFIAMLVVLIRALLVGDPVAGWPSLMTVMLFLGGIILLGIGVLGLYLAKIYTEVKNRPIYLLRESNLARFHLSPDPQEPTSADKNEA